MAPTTRTSAWRARASPSRVYSPLSSTRSKRAWVSSGSSPSSSRNNTPPAASPTSPGRSGMPGFGYPRRFPNNSASASVGGIVAALRETNGPAERAERA